MKSLRSSLEKLVAILNDGQFHDGTTLGDKLHITRSAVWKTMNKLEAYGIEIESIKGKGYALLEPLILLNPKHIKQQLHDKNIAIEIFETIHSTNDYLKSCYSKKTPRICLAEQQTQGKGRLNRQWHSPFAQNIYLSCLYPIQKDVSELAGLSLVVSLAIAKTLTQYQLPKQLSVKWPNDVVYEQQKIAGNIIEIQAETNGICHVIIGIGINVNMLEDHDKEINQAWTSLRNITGEYIDRNQLVAALINNLFNYLQEFTNNGLKSFITEWKSVDSLYDKEITLHQHNKKITGIAKGIDKNGHLILKPKEGESQAFSSGDTTILKK